MTNDEATPAFPSHGSMGEVVHEGMTLRDYFAAKALTGMISTAAEPCLIGFGGSENTIAKAAYKMADAMLEERDK